LTSLSMPRTAGVALIIGAFALGACGGAGTPTPAPSTAAVTTPAPTVAVTAPAATTEPSAAATNAPASLDPAVDPAEDLEIAAPYSFRALDEAIAQIFVNAMEQSLGEMADVFQIGVREAVKDDDSQAYVIVMRFPDLPIAGDAFLDAAAEGATQSGGTVESRTIGGESVRVVDAQGQTIVMFLLDEDLVMVISLLGKSQSVGVATAIIEAN
jgi:hypothetical protein